MKTLLVLASLLMALQVGAAQVYRWTDQNGQVHFSQRPPPGAAQRMDLPESEPRGAPGDTELMQQRRERERRLLEDYDYERAQKKARQAREASARQKAAEQCGKLQDYWRRLTFPGPLYVTRDDGEREYLTDEQRESEKARMRPAYVRACGREPQ